MIFAKRFPVFFLSTVGAGVLLFPAQALASGGGNEWGWVMAPMLTPVILVLAGIQALVGKFAQSPGTRRGTAIAMMVLTALIGLGQLYLLWSAYLVTREGNGDEARGGVGVAQLGILLVVLAALALSFWLGRRLWR
ncbi:MAG: hypothetical protein Q8Q09_03595 [Deltaproteobacteria bacterium]|nr:hypothetical protein [Deltaproteobacteria bacterium]